MWKSTHGHVIFYKHVVSPPRMFYVPGNAVWSVQREMSRLVRSIFRSWKMSSSAEMTAVHRSGANSITDWENTQPSCHAGDRSLTKGFERPLHHISSIWFPCSRSREAGYSRGTDCAGTHAQYICKYRKSHAEPDSAESFCTAASI